MAELEIDKEDVHDRSRWKRNVNVMKIERKLEILEKKSQRTCNLVITRLPEVDVGHKVDIKIDENKLVTNILDKLDLINSVNIEILDRIGSKKDNTKRPLKIKVKSILEKI